MIFKCLHTHTHNAPTRSCLSHIFSTKFDSIRFIDLERIILVFVDIFTRVGDAFHICCDDQWTFSLTVLFQGYWDDSNQSRYTVSAVFISINVWLNWVHVEAGMVLRDFVLCCIDAYKLHIKTSEVLHFNSLLIILMHFLLLFISSEFNSAFAFQSDLGSHCI